MQVPQPLKIRLLGEIELERGGVPVPLPPSKKTRALLAYLVMTGRPQRREHLCALFWDVADDPRAGLRWSLSKLRDLFDEGETRRIVADRRTATIDLAGIRVDVLEARDLLSRSLEDLPTADLEEQLAEFRGEFLEGLELPDFRDFQAWCVAEREQARLLHVKILRELVGRLSDRPDEAIPYARTLAGLDRDDGGREVLSDLLDRSRTSGENRGISGVSLFQTPGRSRDARSGREAPLTQQIRFCRAPDGVRLAYATAGTGKPIVKAANWLNHLEFDWQSPVWRHMLSGLTQSQRLIRYDARGNGLSDWDVADISFDAFVQDLETVVDAAGLERFPLLGISQGCAVSIAFAVRHPERVSHLILHGGYARGSMKRSAEEAERREAMRVLMKEGWGQDNPAFRQVFTSLFVPDASEEQMRWFNELQRMTTSPEIALRITGATSVIDVTDLLPQVKVPTLVLHSRREAAVPFDEGRLLATSIPGARFVPLESRNHLILEQEPAWTRFLTEVTDFLRTD